MHIVAAAWTLAVLACTGGDEPGKKNPPGPEGDSDTELTGETGETPPDDTAPEVVIWGEPEAWVDEPALTFAGERPKNIIFLSIDTLQIQRLTRYGGDDTMPFLEGLLDASVTLDNHRSCSNWTFTSVICALGGRDPMDVGHVPTGQSAPVPIPSGVRMLSAFLAERDYASLMVTANPYLSDTWGTTAELDRVIVESGATAQRIISLAQQPMTELTAEPEKPWFLHLHFLDPHIPYDPPDAYLGGLDALDEIPWSLATTASTNAMKNNYSEQDEAMQALILQHLDMRYAAGLRYLDDQLAELWAGLEADGMLDDAAVVFWSDHGEQIYEHGKLGHGISLYDVENSALAAVWAPGLEPLTWTGPTTHRDLLPTLWATMGWEPEPEFTGVPVGAADPNREIFGITYQEAITTQSMVAEGYKLIYIWTGELLLYNLTDDPREESNRHVAERGKALELWVSLKPHVTRLYEEFYADGTAPVDPD